MNHEPSLRMLCEPQAPPGFSVKRNIYVGFVYNLISRNMIHFGDVHPPNLSYPGTWYELKVAITWDLLTCNLHVDLVMGCQF